MGDRALSGLLLLVAAGFGAYLFSRKQQGGAPALPVAPPSRAGAAPPSSAPAPRRSGGLGPPVPLTGPDWKVGKVFKSDDEFSGAVNRAIDRYRQQFRRSSKPPLLPSPYTRFGQVAP